MHGLWQSLRLLGDISELCGQKTTAEIKSFVGRSDVDDLEKALRTRYSKIPTRIRISSSISSGKV
jgi:hypothetical protein